MERKNVKELAGIAIAIMCLLTAGDVGMSWITTAIGAAAGVLSSLWGGHKASQEARKAQKEIDKKEAQDRAMWLRRSNERYQDTAAGQNLITQALSYNDKLRRRAEGGARVAGLSQQAVAKQKEQGNKMMSDTLARVAAGDVAKQQAADNMYHEDMNRISDQRTSLYNTRAQNITNAASQASNALISAGAALDSSGDDFWSGLTKKTKKT